MLTIKSGIQQIIPLPPPLLPVIAPAVQDEDNVMLRSITVKTVRKQCIQLEKDLKRVYAVVFEQCLQDVKDKLATTEGWETVEATQSLHALINKIEKNCVGFDNHR